ncbi:MAG: transporter suffix domain-containing protein [Hyphomicrobiaceae bacterium]
MVNNNTGSSEAPAEAAGGWRYKLGMAMFVLPVISMALTPIIVPLMGFSAADAAAIIGGIVIGGEVIWFASIPLLGKEGFKRVKSQLFSKLKLTDKPISKERHNVGFTCTVGALAFQMLVLVWIVGGFFYFGTDHLTDGVAGVTFAQEATFVVYALIASVAVFFVGVWLLGGRFVDRLGTAMIWHDEVE